MKKNVSRRKFLKLGLATSAIPLAGMSLPSSSKRRYNYKRSIIIDNLASPGLFNVPGRLDNPLTDEMLSNSRKSGITAVNVTVSAGGDDAFKNTVSSLGYWEKELMDHPDYLTKITSVDDIYKTKKEKKLGKNYQSIIEHLRAWKIWYIIVLLKYLRSKNERRKSL